MKIWKIKDGIDLKELEKFGFVKNHYGNYEKWYRTIGYIIFSNGKIDKVVDCGEHLGGIKTNKQDIKRLGIADQRSLTPRGNKVVENRLRAKMLQEEVDKKLNYYLLDV